MRLRTYGAGMPALAFPDPPLRDEVVALRPWREGDVSATVMAFRDPLLRRFSVPVAGPVTAVQVRSLRLTAEHARLAGRELNVAFVSPDDESMLLGGGSIYDVDPDSGCAAVGYWLAPEARGRGIATHATQLLTGWAFDALQVQRLELTSAPENKASHRVAERCGFTREGVLRSHRPFQGARRDTVMFSLLPGELR